MCCGTFKPMSEETHPNFTACNKRQVPENQVFNIKFEKNESDDIGIALEEEIVDYQGSNFTCLDGKTGLDKSANFIAASAAVLISVVSMI